MSTGLNCDNDNPDEIVRCLRNKTEEEILSIEHFSPDDACIQLPWWPVVEPDFGQEHFLENQPNEMFEIGNFSHVPTLIGIASDEFAKDVPGESNSLFVLQSCNI